MLLWWCRGSIKKKSPLSVWPKFYENILDEIGCYLLGVRTWHYLLTGGQINSIEQNQLDKRLLNWGFIELLFRRLVLPSCWWRTGQLDERERLGWKTTDMCICYLILPLLIINPPPNNNSITSLFYLRTHMRESNYTQCFSRQGYSVGLEPNTPQF